MPRSLEPSERAGVGLGGSFSEKPRKPVDPHIFVQGPMLTPDMAGNILNELFS